VASNLRRSKRTVGKRIVDIDRRVSRLQRTPPARRIGRGVIAASNLAQNSVTYSQLTGGIATDISGAQSTADGKNAIFYSATTPTPRSSGDLWFDTDNDYALSKWNGTIWEPFGLGSAAFSYIDAGKITVGTLSGREVVCEQTTVAIGSTIITKAQMLSTGSIYSKYDYSGLSPSIKTEVFINSLDRRGIQVLDTPSLLTTLVTGLSVKSRNFIHDDYDVGNGFGRFTSAGAYVNIGEGGQIGPSVRIVRDDDLYDVTSGRDKRDVVVTDQNFLVSQNLSSIKFKENINNLTFDYKNVLAIQPVTFHYKYSSLFDVEEGDERSLEYGVIAEQVEEAGIPELVGYKDGEPHSVAYRKLPIFLLEVCRKQEEVIEDLKARVSALEAQK
jgi:hypothetical protein